MRNVTGPHFFAQDKIIWFTVDTLSILVARAPRFNDDEWLRYLAESREVRREHRLNHNAALVYFMQEVPSSAQRRMTIEFMREHKIPHLDIAYLTDSTVVRGAATALSWLMPRSQLRGFSPSDVDGALRWLATRCEFDLATAKELFGHGRRYFSRSQATA